MAAGLTLATLGFAIFTRIGTGTSFATFAIGSFIFSIGFAPVFTLTTDLIIGFASPERAGAASAISETSAEFGGALGIALFGSIGVAVYRSMIDGARGLRRRHAPARPRRERADGRARTEISRTGRYRFQW
jgi:MFS transporter, DHA2 family, multidrug resistance protein